MNPTTHDTKASDGQMMVFNKTLQAHCGTSRDARLYVAERLVGRKLTSTKELTWDEWRAFRDAAFPRWRDGDWAVSPEMAQRIRKAVWDYEKEVLGQQELPL